LLTLCRDLQSAKAIEKQAAKSIESLETRLKLAMGNAAILQHEGRTLATWKTNKDSTKTDWKAAYMDLAAHPGHIKQFTTTAAGNRPLLLKKGW